MKTKETTWEQIQYLRQRVHDLSVVLTTPSPEHALSTAIDELDYRLEILQRTVENAKAPSRS
jgi:hypothetical protein